MGALAIRASSCVFAPPLPLISVTTTATTTTVKIPARLRRIMGLAPVLEFKLSSVRSFVVAVVSFMS